MCDLFLESSEVSNEFRLLGVSFMGFKRIVIVWLSESWSERGLNATKDFTLLDVV